MNESIQALRLKLQQLQAQHASGSLAEAEYAERKAALERSLVALVVDAPDPASSKADAKAAGSTPAGMRLWGALAGFAIVVAAAGYWWMGAPEQINQAPPGFGAQTGADAAAVPATAASAPHSLDSEQVAAMTERLAARMKDQPGDAEGWSMLARSYMVIGRHADAVGAYETAVKLRPDDANLLADYADALALKNGRDLDGEPSRLIDRALKLDPDNLKALALAGTVAYNRGDFAKAVQFWERVVANGSPENPIVQQVRGGIADARERGKLPAGAANAAPVAAAAAPATQSAGKVPAAAATGAAAAAAGAAGTIAGTVALAPALKGKVSAEDSVFILARPAEGSRMPLAFLRKQVKDLPITFNLDDSLAMSPAARLSTTAGPVVVVARISKSGQAMPQPGDLEGVSAAAAVGSAGVAVVIANEVNK